MRTDSQKTREFVEKVAAKRGWVLNPDQELLGDIVDGLAANANRLGYYQCPCRLSWDDRTKDKDIVCPCDYAAADIAQYGHCFCSLYLSPQFAASGKALGSIPERRPANRFPD